MLQKDGKNIILTSAPNKVIFAELNNKQSCRNYRNCISGVFQHLNKANAILIYGKRIIGNSSAHSWLGFPDSCLLYNKNGTFAVKRITNVKSEELDKINWAISGVGLLDMYNPTLEGYAKIRKNEKTYDYSDVLRRTNHTAIGVKDNKVYGLYLSNMNAYQVNNYCKKLNLEKAIMLDGGHIAAANTDIAKANSYQKQHNIIQFVQ